MISIAFTKATQLSSESGRARWEFRGTTACTAAEAGLGIGSIRRLAGGQHRQLNIEKAAAFPEPEADALHRADIANFPLRRFGRLLRDIRSRPLHIVSPG